MRASLPQPHPARAAPLDLRVYAILDPSRCRGRPPAVLAAAAARGGATLIQLRDKASTTRELRRHAADVLEALAPLGVPLVVNDRVDVALAAGAAGVHLGRNDLPPADARRLLGPAAVIGVTIHHDHEAEALDPALADYAGIGPVFTTASKQPEDPPIGVAGFGRLAGLVRDRLPGFPCCAIAGIDHESAGALVAAGADGVAVISDIFMADDVEAAARRLRHAVDRARTEGPPA